MQVIGRSLLATTIGLRFTKIVASEYELVVYLISNIHYLQTVESKGFPVHLLRMSGGITRSLCKPCSFHLNSAFQYVLCCLIRKYEQKNK